ncbi:MAG: GIY-YIG nuclease family protein [Methanobrevibacter sp.]|jgi:Uri superfamily endonuclease|nr:GIY-YIG nuclease family protein [Candidatus Methanovirga aequatorialis]
MENNRKVLKGSYCLIINNRKDSHLKIGSLGEIFFKKGYYVYVGSALNSLTLRLKRHLSTNKKKHWHVDYLLFSKYAYIKDIMINVDDDRLECEIAKRIGGTEIKDFGSSDCNCQSHLLYFEKLEKCLNSVKMAFKDLNIDLNKFNE